MSDPPEGYDRSTLAPGQERRCPGQNMPAVWVRVQMDRLRERLAGKKVYPLYTLTFYAVDCGQHSQPSHHLDLATWTPEQMAPEHITHTISALEAALKALKAGTT